MVVRHDANDENIDEEFSVLRGQLTGPETVRRASERAKAFNNPCHD